MKEEDLKLKIGDIAKLCNVSNRSLRHYEKINLLVSSIVDEYSHYRYYGKEERGCVKMMHPPCYKRKIE